MTLAIKTNRHLPLEKFENSHPLIAEGVGLMVYTEVNLAFLDGEPFHTHDVEDIYLALVASCAAVHTKTSQKRSWDTPLGVIEVEPRSFNVTINGVEHTPETVDHYSQCLQQLLRSMEIKQ